MSLYAAMQVAVSGLSAQSASIGNISDNLANSQTTAYKAVTTRFESLVTESNESVNNPGGVSSSPYYTNGVQGTISDSDSATSLAISGAGYFPVLAATTDSDGNTTFSDSVYYTRTGDFNLDADGYLVNSGGYYLTGYLVDEAGDIDTSAVDAIQISDLVDEPVQTSLVDYIANLPASVEDGYLTSSSTLIIYDELGTEHDLDLSWEKTAASTWELTITVADAVNTAGVYSDYTATIEFTFNDTTNAGTLASIAADTSGNNLWTVGTGDSAEISITLDFEGSGTQDITLDFGTYDSASGVTQYADTAISVTTLDQNGIPSGSYESLSIDEDGYVTLNYDNGRSRTIAQIPVVTFFAEDKLARLSGGAYSATLASGSPRYNLAGTNGAGSITNYALESSNVDIATEFTNLIQAQQIYSANAKTITTADSMMDDAINLVR